MHTPDGSTAYRPHPDGCETAFLGQTTGKSNRKPDLLAFEPKMIPSRTSGAKQQHCQRAG